MSTPDDRPHALYRFWSASNELLYVGITVNPGSRWSNHSKDKLWWSDVARVTVERFAGREAVLNAERTAIITEHPRHNVVHNRNPRVEVVPPPASAKTHLPYTEAQNLWTYRSRRHDTTWTRDLYLRWEVNGDPISDNWLPSEIDAADLFDLWASGIDGDARQVPIHWAITPIWELAPFQDGQHLEEDFLTFFTWPHNAHTGERLNFNRLPVVDKLWNDEYADKGGFIQQAAGWKPSPLQPTLHVPLLCAAAGLRMPKNSQKGEQR